MADRAAQKFAIMHYWKNISKNYTKQTITEQNNQATSLNLYATIF